MAELFLARTIAIHGFEKLVALKRVAHGGSALRNRWGTAPGLAMHLGTPPVFALPGVNAFDGVHEPSVERFRQRVCVYRSAAGGGADHLSAQVRALVRAFIENGHGATEIELQPTGTPLRLGQAIGRIRETREAGGEEASEA